MKLAALAALVMLVASCCPCRKHRKGDGKPFVGTEWQLVQLNGRAVPVEGDLFTVVFGEDGRLSGLGACNRFMGSYQTTETGGLTVGQNIGFDPDVLAPIWIGSRLSATFCRERLIMKWTAIC